MIEIKCAATDTAAALCTLVGVSADAVLEMTECDERIGFVCILYNGTEAILSFLKAPDTALTDALLRAALNTARAAGARTATVTCEPLVLHMKQKGYLTVSDPARIEIADFFAKTVCKA